MVSKQALLFTGLLAAGAAVALLVDRAPPAADPRLGKPVLDPAAAATVDRIELAKTGGATVVLVRGADDVWHVGDVGGFPVDAARVVRFFDELSRASLQMVAGTVKDQAAEFGLTQGTKVQLAAKSAPVLTLDLGDARQGGGQYLAAAGEDKVYLASQALAPALDQDQWELKTLLDVPKEQVRAVQFSPEAGAGKQPVRLAREKAEDALKVEGLADPTKETPAVKGVEGQFVGLAFSKRYDTSNVEAQAAFTKPSRASLALFDGRTYDLEIGAVGDKPKKYFLRIQGKAPDSAGDDSKAKVQTLNDLMARHAFEVPEHIANRLTKGEADFVTATPKG